MTRAGATIAPALSEFEAAVLRALVDLDAFSPYGAFRVGTIQRRSGQHGLKGELWKRWLHLVRDGLAMKTGDQDVFSHRVDSFAITPFGRERLAAHDAAQKARRA